MNSIVIMYIIAFVIIADIPTVIENVFTQGEKADQKQGQSLHPSPTFDDDNNNDMIISEEICPPYCNLPPPIQELP
jgi:hypothetical protein